MFAARRFVFLGLSLSALTACSKQERNASSERASAPGTTQGALSAAPSAAASALPAPTSYPTNLSLITGAGLLAKMRSSGAKGTIVNAWASWCGPCRREIPMLDAMAANLKPQGVEIVLVSVDDPQESPQAEAFLRDNHIGLPSLLAAPPLAVFKRALNPRWPGMLPATFLFDNAGKLRYFWGGPAYENELLPIIEGYLAGQPIDGEAQFGLAPGKVEH